MLGHIPIPVGPNMQGMVFLGFPYAGVDFYRELEDFNNQEWWSSHADIYRESVRAPFEALLDELADEFGRPKIFRPNRDLRFTPDKSPYKTHQGAIVVTDNGGIYYLHLDADGLFAGGGSYHMSPDQLARYRKAVSDAKSGQALEDIVEGLRAHTYEIAGDQLRGRPRGVDADAPRLDLLRMKSLHAMELYGTPRWLSTPEVKEHVRRTWHTVGPLVSWLDTHVGRPHEVTGGHT